jgi:predicted HAD superfamily Cof-like phosphohydrolase
MKIRAAINLIQWKALAFASAMKAEMSGKAEHDLADVLAFQKKFGVPMAAVPSFLDRDAVMFRIRFMAEELQEFALANAVPFEVKVVPLSVLQVDQLPEPDIHQAADALIDLSYVVRGTSLMMCLPWSKLWRTVHAANMAKVRAQKASDSKRGSTLDIVKPAGWVAPDHTAALGESRSAPIFKA